MIKISILSDLHFGYAWNSFLENDSFENAQEAISKSLDSDLIIIAGDVFDTRMPKTDMWARALRILSRPFLRKNDGIKLVDTINKELKDVSQRTLQGIPMIAIGGTHDRRASGQINAVQALEQTGFLLYLHRNGLIFEKGGQKIAIQGMSAVPERYAKQFLDQWNPKPIGGCFNALIIHQSVDPYVYSPLDPPTLDLSNLPRGFDVIVNGHIHSSGMRRVNGTTLLMPGSTIVTQLKAEEADKPKGFYKLSVPDGKVDFVELETPRKFFYREIFISERESVVERVEDELNKVLNQTFLKKPILRLKAIMDETEFLSKEWREMERKYEDKLILKFVQEIKSEEISKGLEVLREEERMSVEEMGLKLFSENLQKLKFERNFDPDDLFKLLMDGKVNRAFDILTGKQKTLRVIFEGSGERSDKEG